MKITLNAEEVRYAIEAYVDNNISLAGGLDIVVNEDGTATVGINEKVDTNVEDTPPVVEKKTRKPREAKHVMVEKKAEPVESVANADGVVAEAVEEEKAVVKDVKQVEEPAEQKEVKSAKPSLFANLAR